MVPDEEYPFPRLDMAGVLNVFEFDLLPQRWSQLRMFGPQAYPDGTGGGTLQKAATLSAAQCEHAFEHGHPTWRDVIMEKFYVAIASQNHRDLREGLVELGAIVVAWIEDLDRRELEMANRREGVPVDV